MEKVRAALLAQPYDRRRKAITLLNIKYVPSKAKFLLVRACKGEGHLKNVVSFERGFPFTFSFKRKPRRHERKPFSVDKPGKKKSQMSKNLRRKTVTKNGAPAAETPEDVDEVESVGQRGSSVDEL